jgi:hypothetical protein
MSDAPAGHDSDAALLHAFLRDRDHPCPECLYNLRNLELDRCPECNTLLRLQVGRQRPHFVPLVLAVTPCSFSFICACFFLFGMLMSNEWALEPMLMATFGLFSGLVGLILLVFSQRFGRLKATKQRAVVLGIWSLHLALFVVVVLLAVF